MPHHLQRLLVVVLAALSIAGCAQPAPTEPALTESTPGLVIDGSRPDTAFGEIVTGPAVGPDVNATLAAPPKLVPGEWWRLRFASPLAGTQLTEVVRVVAAVEPEGYLIGMPHEGWAKEVISYHSPALGDVGLDLSYPVHNEVYQPVKFPLEAGATWTTVFGGAEYAAEVESTEGTRATVVLTPQGEPQPSDALFALAGFTAPNVRLVYDAAVHEIVSYESGLGTFEVVEHGYGFEGWITIPRAEHTAIEDSQVGPADPGEVPVPRSIEVAGGFNRMTLLQAIIPLGPGVYKVRAVAPDGAELVTDAVDQFTLNFHEVSDTDGMWTTQNTLVGPGIAFSMGIAYHQYDIRLPDGARRADHSHPVVR